MPRRPLRFGREDIACGSRARRAALARLAPRARRVQCLYACIACVPWTLPSSVYNTMSILSYNTMQCGNTRAAVRPRGVLAPRRQRHAPAPLRTPGSTVQYSTVQYSTVQYSTVQYSTVQYSTLRYVTLRYVTLHYHISPHVTLHCIALHHIAVHFIAFHCIASHCIALHCIASHHVALQYVILRYIAWRNASEDFRSREGSAPAQPAPRGERNPSRRATNNTARGNDDSLLVVYTIPSLHDDTP